MTITVDPSIGRLPSGEARFRAMGTDCHVIVVGAEPSLEEHLGWARRRVIELEGRWSRFLGDSEISRLSAAAGSGEPVEVSVDTILLLERSRLAHRVSRGRFNPLMGRELKSLGYDRSWAMFDSAEGTGPSAETGEHHSPLADPESMVIEPDHHRAALPVGAQFDPGGIGKGLAADLIASELIERDCWGALVNLGGDLRVVGAAPVGLAWNIEVTEPALHATNEWRSMVRLTEGAVATSTTLRRRWSTADGRELHHLINPVTRMSTTNGVVLTTVVAGEAWWAEVAATALMLGGPVTELPACSGVRVYADARTERFGHFEDHEVPPHLTTSTEVTAP